MMAIRRKTRETLRHERAVVLQELGTPPAAAVQADIEANKRKAELLRKSAAREKVCECIGNRRPNPECYWHGER